MKWVPINLAPKDGTWLMLAIEGRNEVLIGFWHRLHGAWWGQSGSQGEWKKWQQATHFQHLPTPPGVQTFGFKTRTNHLTTVS